MENKLVTHFYLKQARKDRTGMAPIYLRITVNGNRAEVSTNKKIEPECWDSSSERVKGRSEFTRLMNAHLINLKNKVERYFLRLDGSDERVSVQQLVMELKGKGANQMTLIDAYKHHNKRVEDLVGIDYSPLTLKRYESSLSSVEKFLTKVYHKTDIRLCDLKHDFIEDYYTYLRATKNLKHNSAVKNIKNLFRITNLAVLNKWLQMNPFKSFKCSYKENYRKCLTQEEIDTLYNKDLSIQRLAQVRDVYIFQIYTGLAYSDLAKLTYDDVQTGIDGQKWIIILREKTGVRSSIPLLPRALEVIRKYEEDPFTLEKGLLLPICSNQRMNGYLKEIAFICNIEKNLTTHLARHTFATTVTLTNGVPIESVSKMLGHTNIRTTQIYSKVIDRKVSNDMKHLRTETRSKKNSKNMG